jgi:propanediol utilization protein
VYLTDGTIEELFCDGYRLHERLSPGLPGEYLAQESVTLIGPRGGLANIPIIGPPRQVNQVELTRMDALGLGIEASMVESRWGEATPDIYIKGPRTTVKLDGRVVGTSSHVRMNPLDADRLGFEDQDRVDVASEYDKKRILFRDVGVRVAPDYQLGLHVDAQDCTASGLSAGDFLVMRKGASRQL